MKKSLFLFALCCTGILQLQAQEAVLSSGSDAFGNGGSASYSVGQIDFHVNGSNNEVIEGVQQPYEIFSLSVGNFDDLGNNISLYPNPVDNLLFVDVDSELPNNVSFVLYDTQGNQLNTGVFDQNNKEFNLSALPASVYFLDILVTNKRCKSFKIIKN
ncbi:T9SS type A sorting domain-containing protein [Fluviicola sp.]|uniref:T9SS type A sorting domain-containing protein n=1 Tax=Fluviicola sp. TaxID=1917219 RepID=UPI0031D1C8ED